MRTFVTDKRGVRRIIPGRVEAYKAAHPDAAVVSCLDCGRSWDDAIVTGWTPAPAARCPFEGMRRLPKGNYFPGE